MIHPVILKPNIGSNGLLNGLVSAWEFENNALDSHGSNDGTVNGATYTSSGKIEGCYDFDGTNDYIKIPYDSSIIFDGNSESYSVSLWVKHSTQSGHKRIINTAYSGNSLIKFPYRFIAMTDGTIKFYVYDGSNITQLQSTSSNLDNNSWHHIVGVVNQSTDNVYLFVDGELVTTETNVVTSSTSNTNDLIIGRQKESDSNYSYDGLIDQPAIWSRALTATEVAALYNNGDGLPYSQFTN